MFQAQELIVTLRKDDETKRNELRTIYLETLATLADIDERIQCHLRDEGTIIEDVQSDIKRHLEHLSTNDCPILVAGGC